MNLLKRKSLCTIVLIGFIIIFIFISIFFIVLQIQNKHYTKIMNSKINAIVNNVVENYPDVKEEDILKILNSRNNYSEDILKKYGYDDEISNIKDLQKSLDIHNNFFIRYENEFSDKLRVLFDFVSMHEDKEAMYDDIILHYNARFLNHDIRLSELEKLVKNESNTKTKTAIA